MRDLRIQYVLTFGMLGTVLPYVSVFFSHAGLTKEQIGYAWAIWCGALVLSPVVVTMLADARIDPRRLLAVASVTAGAGLLCLGLADGVATVLGVWTVYCLVSLPVLPLQDGIHFSLQRRRQERGEAPLAYPRVRVWGTIGFIVPSVLLFGFLQAGMSLRGVLMAGAAFAALAAVQAFRLDDPRAPHGGSGALDAKDRLARGGRVPTLEAARVLLGPRLLVFTAALVLVQAAGAVHGAFYPVYLTERVGIAEKWLGQISNLAVFIEIFFVYGCGLLTRRFGVKNVMLAAMAVTVLRFGLLASSNNVWAAVGSQVFHGILLIAIGVVPPMVLDEAAEDRFRHSMQGLYVMITGAGRAVANLVAGPVAAWSLAGLYGLLAVTCLAAGGLILFGFSDPARANPAAVKTEAKGRRGDAERCPVSGAVPVPETA